MASPNISLDIVEKNGVAQIVRIHGLNNNRQTPLARLDQKEKTLYWLDVDQRDDYHKSVMSFLEHEKITITTQLMEGQKPDVIPKNAPPRPAQHKMQGDLTPDLLEWLQKYAPVEFTNVLGVYLKPLAEGEKEAADIRERWVRDDVVRTVKSVKPGSNGGELLATKFKSRDQIIARRASHLTFTKKEILREQRDAAGELQEVTAIPFDDRYSQDALAKAEKAGKIEIVFTRPAAGSATSAF